MTGNETPRAALVLLCAVLACSAARAAGGDAVQKRWNALPEQVQTVLSHVEKAGEGLKTLRADVEYTRSIPLLEEKEQCTGTLLFHTPDRLALRLGEPRNEDIYSNGDRWWVVSHDQQQVEIYRAVENPRRAREAVFLKFGYGRSVRSLLTEYSVEIARTNQVKPSDRDANKVTEYVLRFTPRKGREVPSRYSWIEVAVREGRWMPARIKLAEDGGRILHVFRMANRTPGVEVEEGTFTYTPPEGYNILRPAKGKPGTDK